MGPMTVNGQASQVSGAAIYTIIPAGMAGKWLVDHEPAGSDLNSTYQLPDGDCLYYFGNFLIINDEGM